MGVFDANDRKHGSKVDLTQFHTFVSASSVIREKLEVVKKIADTSSSVLILGQSGVGKELFAEQIHLRSSRAEYPFVRVNCAALPDSMLESELFGHVKGAFTDAIKDRKGRFEVADHGTIFLDEIGDMPLLLQGKLLRVLQNKRFERLGSSDTIYSDVRIIAATNKNLEKMVENGSFRSDLYFRLNVLPVYVPSLRERKEDIVPLAAFFLKQLTWDTKKKFEGFSDDAIRTLMNYDWPGNIRELQNVVERSCVLGTPPFIQANDFMLKSTCSSASVSSFDSTSVFPLKEAVDMFKKEYVLKVLALNGYNQTVTAQVLKVQRTYLSRLMKDLNIR